MPRQIVLDLAKLFTIGIKPPSVKTTLMQKQTPLQLDGIKESIYAGFWTRFGSLLMDFVIMIPVLVLTFYLYAINIRFYYYLFLPNLVLGLWYWVYLVKRYGGTPGKLIVGIRIIKLDGQAVTWREAFLRYVVNLIIAIFGIVVIFIAVSNIDETYYNSLTWLQKQAVIGTVNPLLFKVFSWTNNIWLYGELIVLLTNKRKRAIHDFIAGTVIVKAKYIDRIREVMQDDIAEGNTPSELPGEGIAE